MHLIALLTSPRSRAASIVLALGLSSAVHAYGGSDWPTKFKADAGVEFGVKGLYQFDSENFSHGELPGGGDRFEGLTTWRRKEFGFYAKKAGVFEITLAYDFAAIKKDWLNNYFKLFTKDYGDFRVGQFKTPVGWDQGNTGAGATVFMERALPVQAVYEGRRLGVDWQYTKAPGWLFNLAWFDHHDLGGNNEGSTYAGRVVFTPIERNDTVLHAGLTASQEDRDDRTARIRARPEANLTPVRLVDSGTLRDVDHIDRIGVEGAWRKHAWMLQGEYLAVDVSRDAGADFRGEGFYVFAAYLLTGESHPYKDGAFGNPAPQRAAGAWELALRYSQLDLNDGPIRGGKQRDWTLGLNYYLSPHFKLQANYVRAYSDRGALALDPRIFEMRAQLSF